MELYPIRIDVLYPPIEPSLPVVSATTTSDTASIATASSNHKTPPPPMIRIIDTLVLDPKLLSDGDHRKRNVVFAQLAHSIISDAFVVGVSKSTTATTAGKRTEFSGRYTITDTTTTATSNVVASSIQNNIACYDSLMQQAIQQMQTQFFTIQKYEQIMQGGTKNNSNSTNIPIQLRMEISSGNNNSLPIRYHDDFVWDYSNQFISPLQMAQSIVNDLHLPRESVPIITIHILEQIIQHCANATTAWNDDDVLNLDDDDGMKMGPTMLQQQPQSGGQASNNKVTAAWEISQAVHNTNIVHLETIHKQQVPTK